VPMQHSYQVMPPLAPEEEAALRSDIKTYGVKNPIHVDEEDNTLDGFNRRRICQELGIDCPKEVIPGLTDAQKREHAYRMNLTRRHLTRAQKYEIARTLRQEGWTQERIAQALGLSQATVSRRLEQSIQMHKLPQAETIRGKDGRAYPPARARKSAKRQTERMDTAERASMAPILSEDSSTDADARRAKGMQQQDAMRPSDNEPERPPSRGAGGGPPAPEFPDASSPGNSITPAAELEAAVLHMGSLPAAWGNGAREHSWVSGLEALLSQVQALHVQGDVPRLSAHWHPETRTRCLNAIRRMKKALKKLEEMIRHEIGEAASTNGNNDVDTSASDIRSLLAEDRILNSRQQ
jgi:ParB-like chromosome segregation protein Spo0J